MPTTSILPESPALAIEKAKKFEKEGDLMKAASLYEQAISSTKAPHEFCYDRLVIIYRKLKKYKDELRIVNKGIRVFEAFYKKPKYRKSIRQHEIADLSSAFAKKSGLQDNKGNVLFKPEPISRWLARKPIIEKKLQKG